MEHVDGDCQRVSGDAYKHRMEIMYYFNSLSDTFVRELDDYYVKLGDEITEKTEGRPELRRFALTLVLEDHSYNAEVYSLELNKENVDYHQRLIASDNKFSREVNVVTDEDLDTKNPAELKCQERKRICKETFQQHLNAMNRLRDLRREHWEGVRTSITIYTDPNPVRTPGPHGSTISTLRTPLEPLWTH